MSKIFLSLSLLVQFGALAQTGRVDAGGQIGSAPDSGEERDERDELSIAALQGLMSVSPERSLPLVKRVLESSRSERVKSRALFVLSQIKGPAADALLTERALTKGGALQKDAIRNLGIRASDAALKQLIALAKAEPDLRRSVLQALLIARKPDLVLQLATESTGDEALNASIDTLGAMGAASELRQLAQRGRVTAHLIRAYGLAGDVESLQRIMDDSTNVPLQLEAVRALGLARKSEVKGLLRQLYQKGASAEVKRAALQSMMMQQDEEGVFQLYRSSTQSAEKRQLLQMLTMMNSDHALEAIDAALENK
jgi:hypothetical protein